jgi:hypothetical protein
LGGLSSLIKKTLHIFNFYVTCNFTTPSSELGLTWLGEDVDEEEEPSAPFFSLPFYKFVVATPALTIVVARCTCSSCSSFVT